MSFIVVQSIHHEHLALAYHHRGVGEEGESLTVKKNSRGAAFVLPEHLCPKAGLLYHSSQPSLLRTMCQECLTHRRKNLLSGINPYVNACDMSINKNLTQRLGNRVKYGNSDLSLS
jgi:hypothetical protein